MLTKWALKKPFLSNLSKIFGQVNCVLGIIDFFGAQKFKRVLFENALIEIFERKAYANRTHMYDWYLKG